MTKFQLLTAAAAVLAVPAISATTGEFSAQRLSDIDKTISSDAFEGRGPATRAETKTIDYIADQFNAAGLQPAGDMVNGKRGWTQNVPLLQVGNHRQPSVGRHPRQWPDHSGHAGRRDRAQGAA